jgi:hypothetical protein
MACNGPLMGMRGACCARFDLVFTLVNQLARMMRAG